MFYSKALLTATYKNGKPGKLTEEHEKAEYHPFKTDYLFKNKKIPKDLYVSRLIQQFLIIKTIETELQKLSKEGGSDLLPFFALSYLEQLWRTQAMHHDLQQLACHVDDIHEEEIAKTTKHYLKTIDKLKPKNLLAHFLFHVAGFMHGGAIIRAKYIEPSNRLTDYQISTEQYDFSAAAAILPTEKPSSRDLYQDMMRQVDEISLNPDEYQDILEQGKLVYETMTNIYDDLSKMHAQQPKLSYDLLAVISVCTIALVFVLKLVTDVLNPTDMKGIHLY